jgi:hypothetical protein
MLRDVYPAHATECVVDFLGDCLPISVAAVDEAVKRDDGDVCSFSHANGGSTARRILRVWLVLEAGYLSMAQVRRINIQAWLQKPGKLPAISRSDMLSVGSVDWIPVINFL